MKHWINKNYRTLIITAFLIPIIIVAIVSISHVTKWYGISNPASWAIYLSVGIEIAALSSIAAISANMGNKIYFPFIVVTIIQFIGNIFFSYQYIDMESNTFKSWVELAQPIVGLFGIEQTDIVGHKRFLALFAGGLMPIISLSFLHFLVKFTEEGRKKEEESLLVQEVNNSIEPVKVVNEPDIESNIKEENITPEQVEETPVTSRTDEYPESIKEETIRRWKNLGLLGDLERIEDGELLEEPEEIIDEDTEQPNIPEEPEIKQIEDVIPEQVEEIIAVPNTDEHILVEDLPTSTKSEWEKKNNYLKTFLRNVKNSKRIVGNK